MRHTVMSYDIVAPEPGPSGFAVTPMPLDILAIQHIYGANMTYRTGDDVYKHVSNMFLEHQRNGIEPVTDLDLFFGRLKGRGLRLGVATMDSEKAARTAMLRAKAAHHLDFICGYDTGHGVKPLGGMVEAFARQVGVALPHLAVVGDSPHDIHMARAGKAGRAIGVLTGVSPREALVEAGAHDVIESIAELERIL